MRLLARSAAALTLALAQLGAFAALPVADALLEAKGLDQAVHVEAGDAECATHHDDRYCQVIRSLSSQKRARAVAEASAAIPQPIFERTPDAPVLHSGSKSFGPVGPRAPPLG